MLVVCLYIPPDLVEWHRAEILGKTMPIRRRHDTIEGSVADLAQRCVFAFQALAGQQRDHFVVVRTSVARVAVPADGRENRQAADDQDDRRRPVQ